MEHEDVERAAEAEFDERPYEPAIPPELGWSAWSSQSQSARKTFLNEKPCPGSPRRLTAMAERLSRLQPVLSAFPKIEDDAISAAMLDLIKPINFGDVAWREKAQTFSKSW